MNKPRFKLGDKVLVKGIIREIIPTCKASAPLYGIRLEDGVVIAQDDTNLYFDVDFSDWIERKEQYAEQVKNEVPDEEVPKELHPAVEKFKKLLDDTMVNHPPHYTAGKVECIDALEAATTGLQGIEAVCTANAIKYLWRQSRKNGVEDLKKAIFYIERLIQHYEMQEQSND